MGEKSELGHVRHAKPSQGRSTTYWIFSGILYVNLIYQLSNIGLSAFRHHIEISLRWETCGSVGQSPVECATLDVPIDQFNSSNFAGQTFSLALTRLRGKNATKSLLLNPGGPGGSGGEYIHRRGEQLRTIVGEGYDLLSFDPRGVNQSSPRADCFTSEAQDSGNGMTYPWNAYRDTGALYARAQNVVHSCADVMGSVGAYFNTPNTAADMNSILDAIGQEKLLYWGFSYGTTLGQTYAQLFPNRVGRLIIDGVSNQQEWYDNEEFAFGTMELLDTDATFDEFLRACIEERKHCPLATGFEDVTALKHNISTMLTRLKTDPEPVYINATLWGEVKYTDLLHSGIFFSMYRPVGWPQLAAVLADALQGNFTNAFETYCTKPPYAMAGDINRFVEINDAARDEVPTEEQQHFSTKEEILEHFARISNASVVGGAAMAQSFFERQFWRIPNRHNFKPAKHVETAHPLLILSTTLDPICPLAAAQGAEETFRGSVLVQQLSAGHCSVSMPSKCTADHVRAYLDHGTMPAKGVTCPIDSPYFPGDSLSTRDDDDDDLWAAKSADDRRLLVALRGLGEHVYHGQSR